MADAGRGLRSGAKGAGLGATVGAFGGPIGSAIGAGVGGLGGFLYDMFGGNKHKEQPGTQSAGMFGRNPGQTIPVGTQEQQQLQNQSLQQAISLLQGNGGLNPIAQQAVNRFHTQTVPSLAERFTSMGHSGPGMSGAFQGALGQAGAGLEQDLAAQQYGLLALLAGLGNSGQNIYQPEEAGFGENLLMHLAQVAPQLFNSYYNQQGGNQQQQQQQQAQGQPPIKFPSIPGYQLGGNPLPQPQSALSQILGR